MEIDFKEPINEPLRDFNDLSQKISINEDFKEKWSERYGKKAS